MNHTTMPVTAQGEPIPLIKLGQGRGDEHESGPLETVQTFAAKLRAAGYQEPVLPSANMNVPSCDFCGYPMGSAGCKSSHTEGAMVFRSTKDEKYRTAGNDPQDEGEIPEEFLARADSMVQEGFRAGVLSAIAGGVIIACFYLAWGLVAACLFTAVCVGLVAGMVITQEWK